MDENESDPDRPGRIVAAARDISKFLGERQRHYSQRAQDFGYSKEVFDTVAPNFEGAIDYSGFSGTEESLKKFDLFLRVRETRADALAFDVSSASYAVTSNASATSAMMAMTLFDIDARDRKVFTPPPPPSWTQGRINEYAVKLERLDPELGNLSRGVWQTFYSGTDNAERASLALMRQLYDHFFSILAPDEDVRNSKYFTKKEGEKPLQIHRKERLLFAASVRIQDKDIAELLQGEVNDVLDNYSRLNRLHDRSALDASATKSILRSMQAVIEQWVDAVT
ncbi:MAG: hypothetical protein Q7S51_05895 [Gallionellaceae bacterium]|nr:hypothetical protein [Gallionellaceae bacterium]